MTGKYRDSQLDACVDESCELLERVRRALDQNCLVQGGLIKNGCKVVMALAPNPRLIVDFDRPGSPLGPQETRCDYLLVAEATCDCGWIVPLELKRGQLHADQAIRQLQAGASVAEQLVPQDKLVKFRPVVASGGTSKHERKKLRDRANLIRFHGHVEPVRLMRCGARLVGALRL